MTAFAIQEFIDESADLEANAAAIQGETEVLVDKAAIDALVGTYHDWYARAVDLLPNDLGERFRSEFEGNWYSQKIKDFLSGPDLPSKIQLDEPNPLVSYWQYPVDSAFRGPLLTQRQILAEARQRLQGTGETSEHLALIERICRGFGDFVRPLEDRGRGRVPFSIEDEYDVQTLIHAQLNVFFDDVRPEDWAPEQAGARSRVDFLLKAEKIVFETKMTRTSLGAKEVGEELIIDINRYRTHSDCGALVALIYDPDKRIKNRRALENDLTRKPRWAGCEGLCNSGLGAMHALIIRCFPRASRLPESPGKRKLRLEIGGGRRGVGGRLVRSAPRRTSAVLAAPTLARSL
ncbi:MAG TPA: hypothetical protein VGC49_05175 [Solirubrobacterales bacterium]|jgi:hypothetical protein